MFPLFLHTWCVHDVQYDTESDYRNCTGQSILYCTVHNNPLAPHYYNAFLLPLHFVIGYNTKNAQSPGITHDLTCTFYLLDIYRNTNQPTACSCVMHRVIHSPPIFFQKLISSFFSSPKALRTVRHCTCLSSLTVQYPVRMPISTAGSTPPLNVLSESQPVWLPQFHLINWTFIVFQVFKCIFYGDPPNIYITQNIA